MGVLRPWAEPGCRGRAGTVMVASKELTGSGRGAGTVQPLLLCVVSGPRRCDAQGEGWDPRAQTCRAAAEFPGGWNWAATAPDGGQVWAHAPCTLGARSSLKRRRRSNYVQASEGRRPGGVGAGEGCSLPGALAACQGGRWEGRGWGQLPGSRRSGEGQGITQGCWKAGREA